MAQFARPDADLVDGTWTEDDGTTTDMFAEIDEAAADDNDYVKSVAAPSNAAMAVGLGNVTDPVSSAGHVIRVRARQGVAGGVPVDMTVELRQGYTNEGSQGTLIATLTQADVADSFTDYSHTLSGAEADSITDYNDLQLRFVANQP